MFEWGFDKPTTTASFDQTMSQDIMDFNNFVNQNVFSNTAPPAPTNTMPPMNFAGAALGNIENQEQPPIDYMTYDAPQPTEVPDLGNVTNQQKNVTNQEYSMLDAQDDLNPYG